MQLPVYSIAPHIPPSHNFELGVPNYGLLAPRGCPNISPHAPNNSLRDASMLELKYHENHAKS